MKRIYRIRDKENRNQGIVNFMRDHPKLTQEEVGEHFHIEQSRVSQILKKLGKRN